MNLLEPPTRIERESARSDPQQDLSLVVGPAALAYIYGAILLVGGVTFGLAVVRAGVLPS